MSGVVTIARDSFARQETVRRTVSGNRCQYCGNARYYSGRRTATLFEYGTAPDDKPRSKINWHLGQFCSKPCHDAYHG